MPGNILWFCRGGGLAFDVRDFRLCQFHARIEFFCRALDRGKRRLARLFVIGGGSVHLILQIRRSKPSKSTLKKIHDLEIDHSSLTVKRAGRVINLTPREYALLEFLAFNRGKVVTRTMIWNHLYDEYDENTSNVVDVYIRYLRTKIDKGFDVPLILTRWGEGYMLRGEND